MAIKALEHEPSNGDLIWRNDAIDALAYFDEKSPTGRTAQQVVMGLPTAQHEIVRCKDCKHHWTFKPLGNLPTEICELEQTFYDANVDFCSLAERRTDEGD